MRKLVTEFEWGTVDGGFAWIDGVFRDNHPRRSRAGAQFISSHGAIVEGGQRINFDTPLKFLVPAIAEVRKEASLLPEGLAEASERQFAIADLDDQTYSLFEYHTGLFRAFAELDSPEVILSFANQFGPLGADASISIVDVVPEEPWKMGLDLFWAEPLAVWLNEVTAMSEAIALWDALHEHGAGAHADSSQAAELGILMASGIEDRIDIGLSIDDDGFHTVLHPKGLIGALWLQLHLAVEGDVDFHRCAECRTWFEVSAARGRPDKLYCSDACRMRAYRKRKSRRRE